MKWFTTLDFLSTTRTVVITLIKNRIVKTVISTAWLVIDSFERMYKTLTSCMFSHKKVLTLVLVYILDFTMNIIKSTDIVKELFSSLEELIIDKTFTVYIRFFFLLFRVNECFGSVYRWRMRVYTTQTRWRYLSRSTNLSLLSRSHTGSDSVSGQWQL